MKSVAVLDYGSSNLRSVSRALEHVANGRFEILVTGDFDRIRAAERIVFPGQGAIGQCMQALLDKGYRELLTECINSKPFLGICLGLQTLLDYSEEDGGVQGFGIIPGTVKHFTSRNDAAAGGLFKIPHMGWNTVTQRQSHPLWQDISADDRFYFVHSYYAEPQQPEHVAGSTEYIVEFASAAARDNLFATQFHPEKSQRPGLQLLQNFLAWQP